jgi:hypothetical protein
MEAMVEAWAVEEILESVVIQVLVLIQEVAIGLDFGRKTNYLSVA